MRRVMSSRMNDNVCKLDLHVEGLISSMRLDFWKKKGKSVVEIQFSFF